MMLLNDKKQFKKKTHINYDKIAKKYLKVKRETVSTYYCMINSLKIKDNKESWIEIL